MSAIDDRFAELRREGRKAFLPFVTAGDPSPEVTAKLILALQQAGSAMVEVGIPYSDPIADGPIIQESYTRALDAGVKLVDILQMAQELKPKLTIPIISMVSYSIIQRRGAERFLEESIQAGFSGSIVPDLLVEEAASLRTLCQMRDYSLIHLVTPTTPRERMLRIAESSSGFIYFVSVTGITGERNELPADLLAQVSWLRERTKLPICIGFGISKIEHVRMLAPVADGIIVGSAIVRTLAQQCDPNVGIEEVQKLAQQLIGAMQ